MAEDCEYERSSETVDWGSAPEDADYFGQGLFWKYGKGTCDYFYHKEHRVWLAREHYQHPELCDDYQERPVKKVSPEIEQEIQTVIDNHFTPTSINLLDEVKSIQEQRAAEYEQDGGERSFSKIATIYNTLRGSDLKPSDIALILSILKDVRLYSQDGLHRDSVIDKISYASLWGELIMEERGDVRG